MTTIVRVELFYLLLGIPLCGCRFIDSGENKDDGRPESGVTHLIPHGFNYSPLEVPFPGWSCTAHFWTNGIAGGLISILWATYKSRVSTVLQESDFFCRYCRDASAGWYVDDTRPQRDPFPSLHYPSYQYHVWEAIHQNGNSCDYIRENIIQQSSFKKGNLVFNNRKYNTLMLLEVESMTFDDSRNTGWIR